MIDLLYKHATSKTTLLRLVLTVLAGGFFLGLVAVFVLAGIWADRLSGLPALPDCPWTLVPGIALAVLGPVLMFWSAFNFFRVRGTPVPLAPPPCLVCRGPYAHVRNPMLSGLFFLLFGLGFLLLSVSLVFVFTPVFILLNYLELKKVEEPELVKRLGQDYVEYRKRVRMFIPRLRPYRKDPVSPQG
ncbi:MAG: isoprenylcysteine carboxylmethyltransferase family protein [Candidatus Glassbacteria bacterium]|nr:isoprenylcysteine carboxylmethyltransferase family protein [Candidatus Glassbacteria bacterium]